MPSIEAALAGSERFVLLASPEAAASTWVEREANWWAANKEHSMLLIGLTDGDIVWNGPSQDFDWSSTTALPSGLAGILKEEPRYIDLRWARQEEQLSLRNPRFRDCVADLAAPMHGRPKDELFGEDVRQHRRTVKLARAAVAALIVLVLVAGGAAVIALNQRDEARQQARLATSRQLAATATSLLDTQFDLALLLGVQGLRAEDTPQARSSLFAALERNPQRVAFLHGTGQTVRAVELSPDGSTLASGDVEGTAVIWKLEDRSRVRDIRPTGLRGPNAVAGAAGIESLGFSADGKLLVSGAADGTVTISDVATGASRRTLRAGDRAVGAVALSRDAQLVAAGDEAGNVIVWNAMNGGEVRKFFHGDTSFNQVRAQPVNRLSFSADAATLAVGGDFATTSSWNVRTGAAVIRFNATGFCPRDTTVSAFSPQGGLVGWADSTGVGVVPPGKDYFDSPRAPLPGSPESMAFSGDGKVLAVAGQSAVRLFDAATMQPLQGSPILSGYPGFVAGMALDAKGQVLVAASGEGILLSDLARPHRLGVVPAGPHDVCNGCVGDKSVAFSPDGRAVAWLDADGFKSRYEVRLWDVAGDREIRRFPVGERALALAFTPDGQGIVVVGRGAPVVWSLEGRKTGERRASPNAANETAFDVSVTASGGGWAWYSDGTQFILRDLDSGEAVVPEVKSRFLAEDISRDGMLALGGDDGSITLWDLRSRRQSRKLPSPGGTRIDSLAYSADGRVFASLAGGTITVRDMEKGAPQTTLRLGRAGELALNLDGSLLSAGTQDGTVTLWDLGSRQVLGSLRGAVPQGAMPPTSAFAPDGRTMASAVHGGGLMLWDLSPASWQEHACQVANRDLTAEERRLYVGSALPNRPVCP